MKKRKSVKDDKPTTESQLQSVTDTIREVGGFIIKELNDFRLQEEHNWEEQRQFNKEITQKVDVMADSVQALDARIRYQDDMPERLGHVESRQHELTRRVKTLEDKK